MALLKKYNLAGKEVGQVAIDDHLVESDVNTQLIKDYLVAIRNNARQWSANTKSRAEVNHSGKKPHPQKGTGRARQGYLGAPQYKGGGRVHAPKPKFDQHVRINRKEKKAAIRHLIVEKIKENRIHVLQFENMNEPKTKDMSKFLDQLSLAGNRVLFLGEGFLMGADAEGQMQSPTKKYENLILGIRNIPRVEFMLMPNVSGYDVIVNHDLVIVETAVDQLKVILGGQR